MINRAMAGIRTATIHEKLMNSFPRPIYEQTMMEMFETRVDTEFLEHYGTRCRLEQICRRCSGTGYDVSVTSDYYKKKRCCFCGGKNFKKGRS